MSLNIPKKIVIKQGDPIFIDGEIFPWVIAANWTVSHDGIPVFNCSIMAEQIVVDGNNVVDSNG